MRIISELPRAARRSLGLFLAVVLLTAPAVVLASHQFNDVPASHPFHAQIDAITDAGITAGFSDGGYHPSEPVTRQAMAAFMHRGFGRVGLAVGTDPLTGPIVLAQGERSTGLLPVRELRITVPGSALPLREGDLPPTQFVHVTGRLVFVSPVGPSDGCPCQLGAVIYDAATGADGGDFQFQSFASPVDGIALHWSMEVEGLFAATPGPRTFDLVMWVAYRHSAANRMEFSLSQHSSLSAMTFPFGPTGGNTP